MASKHICPVLSTKKVIVIHSLAFETIMVLLMRFVGFFMSPYKIYVMEVEDCDE